MIEGQLALWLNMATILVLSIVIANFSVSLFVSLLSQTLLNIQVQSRKIMLWFLAVLPWIVSICVALIFLQEFPVSTAIALNTDYTHWHHINEFNWLSWHGATLIAALAFTIQLGIRKLMQLRLHRMYLANLIGLSKPMGEQVFEIELPNPSAFTAGFINKRCFVTSGMLNEMTKEQVQVIVEHEKAHAKMNDPLKKWIFGILADFFIPVVARRLKLHMMLAMEQAADNAVVNQELPSTLVASTLVKVARLNAQYLPLKHNELVVNFGADVLEQRVHFLLGKLSLKPANKIVALILVGLIFVGCLSSIDAMHHLIETVFSH